jgi:hypothetical protein
MQKINANDAPASRNDCVTIAIDLLSKIEATVLTFSSHERTFFANIRHRKATSWFDDMMQYITCKKISAMNER